MSSEAFKHKKMTKVFNKKSGNSKEQGGFIVEIKEGPNDNLIF